MISIKAFVFTSAALALSALAQNGIVKRSSNKALFIERIEEGLDNERVEVNADFVWLAPPPLVKPSKNETSLVIEPRNLDLFARQSCNAGYGYCATLGGCCPIAQNCCSYGYCLDPGRTCCPDGSCDPGEDCCGIDGCKPPDAMCCNNKGEYCEAGNICVIFPDSGVEGCCSDLDCTAAVVSGSTSYFTTTTEVFLPEITAPPINTEIFTVNEIWQTWYWTVTWWYYSYYWTVYQAASIVTYTTIYETTTYTTTATDEYDASSLFEQLSSSLTFTPPESAQTSLADLVDVLPSETGSFSFDIGDLFTTASGRTSARSTTAQTTNSLFTSNGLPAGATGIGGGNSVQWIFLSLAVLSGVLMLCL